MRAAVLLVPLLVLGCKKSDDTDDTGVDCDSVGTLPLSNVSVDNWPTGMAEAITAYEGLSGRWEATACGEAMPVEIAIRVGADSASAISVVQTALDSPNDCGCTHDPAFPNDDGLNVIGYATIDAFFDGYPNPGFDAQNVTQIPVALFDGANQGLRARACAEHLVPPILELPWTDAQVTLRRADSGMSGQVELVGDAPAEVCTLTDWTYVGDIQ